MSIEFFIQKLEEQKLKVNDGNPEVWLRTTYALIEDYFNASSTRARNFQSIINDFSGKKIFGITASQIDYYKKQAVEYIDEIITYLKDYEVSKQKNHQRELIKDLSNIKITPPKENVQPKIIYKTQLPFGTPIGLFWSIIVALISGSYILGQNFGSSKFDKEKSDYYEQLKQLKNDTITHNHLIAKKDSIINYKNQIIERKSDSIILMSENLNNLYLLLGKHTDMKKK